jgi:hypothetical protein
MQWIKERDLFIAQTMAFVQSVTGKKPAAEAREAPRDVLFQSPSAKSAPADETADENRPAEAFRGETLQAGTLPIETLKNGTSKIETAQVTRSSPALSDVRQEIRGRVAAFRAHQELFHRERDEYYNSVLTRVRASTGHALKAPDDQPSKP